MEIDRPLVSRLTQQRDQALAFAEAIDADHVRPLGEFRRGGRGKDSVTRGRRERPWRRLRYLPRRRAESSISKAGSSRERTRPLTD